MVDDTKQIWAILGKLTTELENVKNKLEEKKTCLLYTSQSPRD